MNFDRTTLASDLARGLDRLGLALPAATGERLLDYLALLHKWNRVYNLTAVRDPAEMVARHLLDSLAALPYVKGPRVVDVGTGAGLPGIPLALALPGLYFTLVDSALKRTRFVQQAVGELGLGNVEVINSRVEAYRPEAPFDTVVSRAFASLEEMIAVTAHLCATGGRFAALKGQLHPEELVALPTGYRVIESIRLQVPGIEGERHLLLVGGPE